MKQTSNINQLLIRDILSADEHTLLSPNELEQTELAFIEYAKVHAVKPPDSVKKNILNRIEQLVLDQQTAIQIKSDSYPLLDEHSNWLDWFNAVQDIEPNAPYENIYLHPLESNAIRDLFVVWVKEFVPEEVHHDLIESFLILEGSCECDIRSADGSFRKVRLGAGEFITMQLGETHDIKITSLEPAKAILQWKKIAA